MRANRASEFRSQTFLALDWAPNNCTAPHSRESPRLASRDDCARHNPELAPAEPHRDLFIALNLSAPISLGQSLGWYQF